MPIRKIYHQIKKVALRTPDSLILLAQELICAVNSSNDDIYDVDKILSKYQETDT